MRQWQVTAVLLALEMCYNVGDKCEFNPKTSNLKRQSKVLCLKLDESNVCPMLSVCKAINTGMGEIQFKSNYAEFIVLNSTWKNYYWEGTIERETQKY